MLSYCENVNAVANTAFNAVFEPTGKALEDFFLLINYIWLRVVCVANASLKANHSEETPAIGMCTSEAS